VLHGTASDAERKTAAAPANALVAVDPPADLTPEQRLVWDQLAPQALAERTLVVATAAAFRDLCMAIVWRDKLGAQIEQDGLTLGGTPPEATCPKCETVLVFQATELKPHPLLPAHRGWQQRVEAGLARFKLAPFGKPLIADEKPTDDGFGEFDGVKVN
jgi:hypothetical protein